MNAEIERGRGGGKGFSRGIILLRVNLPMVSYCTESLMTPASQQPFLKTFAQAFKGTVSQK